MMKWKRNNERKYNNRVVEEAGRRFDSKGERELFSYLLELERLDKLHSIEQQPTVYLTRARIGIRPDFKAIDRRNNSTCFIEYKGVETDTWKIKKKLWRFYGPAPLQVWKGYGKSLKMVEEIIPVEKQRHWFSWAWKLAAKKYFKLWKLEFYRSKSGAV